MNTKRKVIPLKKFANHTAEQRAELFDSLVDYIKSEPIPIFKDWCTKNWIKSETVEKWEEFSDLRYMLRQKKEANLEAMTLLGQIDKSMAIFSLKQLGWRDQFEAVITTDETLSKALKKVLGTLPEG